MRQLLLCSLSWIEWSSRVEPTLSVRVQIQFGRGALNREVEKSNRWERCIEWNHFLQSKFACHVNEQICPIPDVGWSMAEQLKTANEFVFTLEHIFAGSSVFCSVVMLLLHGKFRHTVEMRIKHRPWILYKTFTRRCAIVLTHISLHTNWWNKSNDISLVHYAFKLSEPIWLLMLPFDCTKQSIDVCSCVVVACIVVHMIPSSAAWKRN